MKKRGFGEGKYNGPGGKIRGSEKVIEAAIRETEEETGLKPLKPVKMAILDFFFGDVKSPQWKVHVYKSIEHEGNLRETEEALASWIEIDEIPYEMMWEDDQYWLPLVLAGSNIEGKFWFTADMKSLLNYKIIKHEPDYFGSEN